MQEKNSNLNKLGNQPQGVDLSQRQMRNESKVSRMCHQRSSVKVPGQRFAIYTNSAGNYFFGEIRDLLASGLEELGFEVDIRNEIDGFTEDSHWNIVIAPHEFFYLGDAENHWPTKGFDNLILVTSEQPSTHWFDLAAKYFCKAQAIWDINYQTSKFILRKGFPCSYLPLGYLPDFDLFREVKELPENYGTCFLEPEISKRSYLNEALSRRPIDVLFIGGLTPRRDEFFAKAASVLSSYQCYLRLLDTSSPLIPGKNTFMNTPATVGLEQRSKVILNIHRDQDNYFEWHRIVMHGIWCKALVISEPCNPPLPFQPGVDFAEAPLEEITETLHYYLSTPEGQEEAQSIATQGYKTLTEKCKLADFLNPLVSELYDLSKADK